MHTKMSNGIISDGVKTMFPKLNHKDCRVLSREREDEVISVHNCRVDVLNALID